MFVCVYIYTYIYIYVYLFIYLSLSIYIYICISIYIYIYIEREREIMYVHIYTYIYIYTYEALGLRSGALGALGLARDIIIYVLITVVKKDDTNTRPGGAFFPYLNNTIYDLDTYGIYIYIYYAISCHII